MSSKVIDKHHCNILVVPWPFELNPKQFSQSKPEVELSHEFAKRFEFSTPDDKVHNNLVVQEIEGIVHEAEAKIGPVHLVVLPELALTRRQFELLRDRLVGDNIILVAGIIDSNKGVKGNVAAIAIPSESKKQFVQFEQSKHHRWRLDEDQIVRYGLTSKLDPAYQWWEGIEVNNRKVNFVQPRSWLSMCVLLCEDLAQIDPVGRLVRAVAPDLVIALLMDGPQLESRWSSRYATVLADDPGSSVLTVTSLGMLKLSRLPSNVGAPVPRVIAAWKDPVKGVFSIDLPSDKTAAIITVRDVDVEDWTADGRSNDLFKMGTPSFGGVQFI